MKATTATPKAIKIGQVFRDLYPQSSKSKSDNRMITIIGVSAGAAKAISWYTSNPTAPRASTIKTTRLLSGREFELTNELVWKGGSSK